MVDGIAGSETVLQSGVEVKFGESEAVFMQGQSAEPQDPVSSVGSEPGQTIIAAPKAEMVLRYLAVTDGPSKGTTVQLKAGATSIGRDQGNDIQISDASISREHAVIISSSKESKIVDLGSSTGTTVNGESVGGGRVGPGDVISIGANRMSFVAVDASSEPEIAEAAASDAPVIMETPSGGVAAVLVVQSGPDAGKSFQVTEGDNLVGRDPSANILLSDESASRRHAILRKRDTSYAVYDLNSSGGTRINDVSVGGTTVSAGQEIKFGKSTAVIMDPASAG
jgi:pSer/pThr/pTyr-binding forkhead associated (FHA) protein